MNDSVPSTHNSEVGRNLNWLCTSLGVFCIKIVDDLTSDCLCIFKMFRSHGPDQEVFSKTTTTTTTTTAIPLSKTDDPPSIISVADLLYISNQVAAGVLYLASQHFIHRDLATRNCLVGDKLRIKVWTGTLSWSIKL